ncbi:hypothetical protein H109_05919 [Trichophyton interdigitale MR816]|uniref:Uncharacterized protein n=1 Tax=Trichophyton interdigitale (strain MR816) TaxID=1215338 RepID=A0A059J2P7_TRIIM|nr:hypothetical protein H101_05236 [Trichophyton interdigitale H6]KDB22130.1 hypothetical protein H109_05919 [Trichophyton interdigitale MR816]
MSHDTARTTPAVIPEPMECNGAVSNANGVFLRELRASIFSYQARLCTRKFIRSPRNAPHFYNQMNPFYHFLYCATLTNRSLAQKRFRLSEHPSNAGSITSLGDDFSNQVISDHTEK